MGSVDTSDDAGTVAQWYDYDPGDYEAPDIMTSDPETNVSAFLAMLRRAEHRAADAASGDAYRTFYGGARFSDVSDHPVLTGELRGVPLPPAMCVAAGFPSGKCVSTAAGAYQITVPTWREFREYRGPRLPDFSPASQDEAARRILLKTGALDQIARGDIEGAIRTASARWASLPGSTAKQNPKSLATVLAYFNDATSGTA